MKRVAIVGLGLIGGSIALALRERSPGVELVACDFAGVLAEAEASRLGVRAVCVSDREAVRKALFGVDLAVLATPVQSIIDLLPDALAAAKVVTDCGSTKRAIADSVAQSPERARFVPGHPMAGLPRGGLRNAKASLFDGETWVLCPEHASDAAVEQVTDFVRLLGATVCTLEPEAHDRAVALTSHVPQLLASVLTVLLARRGAEAVAGPAFKSATRVAGGPAAMWGDIFATNAGAIAEVLEELGAEVERAARALRQPEPDVSSVLAVLERARRLRTGD